MNQETVDNLQLFIDEIFQTYEIQLLPLNYTFTLQQVCSEFYDVLILTEQVDNSTINKLLLKFPVIVCLKDQESECRFSKIINNNQFISFIKDDKYHADFIYPLEQLQHDFDFYSKTDIITLITSTKDVVNTPYGLINYQLVKQHPATIINHLASIQCDKQIIILSYFNQDYVNYAKFNTLTITSNLTRLLNLDFVNAHKINNINNQLPCATLLKYETQNVTKITFQPTIQKYNLISQKILKTKQDLYKQQNYYSKISSQQYILAKASNSQLGALLQNTLNSQKTASLTHLILDNKIDDLHLEIVLIVIERADYVPDGANLIFQIDCDFVPPNFDLLESLTIEGSKLEVYLKQKLDQVQIQPKPFQISSNSQFNSLFGQLFDFTSQSTQFYKEFKIPPFKTTSAQNQKFARQFLDYINVFVKLDQEKIDRLLKVETDVEKYHFLKECCPKMFEQRKELRTGQLERMLKLVRLNGTRFNSLLDIGCADGQLTEQTANLLQTPIQNVYGVDIRSFGEKEFTFLQCDFETEKIPLPNDFVEAAIVTQVLHHVHGWKNLLKEIQRVLKPNGILIVRESLLDSEVNQIMLDIQHGLYACCICDEMDADEFVNQFQTEYISQNDLQKYLQTLFRVRNFVFDGKDDKFQKCWYVCVKNEQQWKVTLE
ncbi:Methyltransferase_domain-containing protein [Hexamita inflata]|uniref:Methyltransferase_domain-containing protein n=1 Tax=Hexamita inflata TaxID=28002 RepID=A0ABP1IKY1_9EUKA